MPVSVEKEGILSFGKNLRQIRKEKNISMQALANIAEIERSQISRIELGKINPKLSTILILANALQISPQAFFSPKE